MRELPISRGQLGLKESKGKANLAKVNKESPTYVGPCSFRLGYNSSVRIL